MKQRTWLAVPSLVLVAASASMATTLTFATFADPSNNAAQPMFQMAPDYSSLSASWNGTGLTLNVPFAGQTYQDVQFQLTGSDPTQPGYIEFWNANGAIMRVDYTSAVLNEVGFGARDTLANPGRVEITYYPWPGFNPTSESFAFSFANFVEDVQSVTATAAFTSSAIPEPATLAFLIMGCLPLIRRR